MFEVMRRSELRANGWTSRAITEAVRDRRLLRARQDNYLAEGAPVALVQAVRVGGRLDCLSLLAQLGVFVHDRPGLHVHMRRGASRMRSPLSRQSRLPPRHRRSRVTLHWHELIAAPWDGAVAIVDAVAHAVRCQSAAHAIATIDSALNAGLLTVGELDLIFEHLPQRFRILRAFVDGRAQSGPETLVRLMARRLGCAIELQVHFDGVGNVDLLLDEWLVVECDSRAHHSSWDQQLIDYRRDLALAARGINVLRLTAEDILYSPHHVFEALRALLARGPVRPAAA